MCQLTLAHFKDKELNALYTVLQSLRNTETTHQDGFGYFGGIDIRKWALTPNRITNLQKIVLEGATKRPLLSHVRLATRTNGKTVVSDEKSHPFLFPSGRGVLAHNGALDLEDRKEMKNEKYEGMIDTEIFVEILDEFYANNNLHAALSLAIGKFRGKFAFLIYEKETDKYWIARGLQAKLHVSKVYILEDTSENENEKEIVGLVVNTDERALTLGLKSFIHAAKFLKPELNLWATDPEILESNSLFKLDEENFDLEKVGDLKERAKVWTNAQDEDDWGNFGNRYSPVPRRDSRNHNPHRSHHRGVGNLTIHNSPTTEPEQLALLASVAEFLDETGMTIEELDELFLACCDSPLLYASVDEVSLMTRYIFPFLVDQISGNKRKIWDKMTIVPMARYSAGSCHFPWMLNQPRELRQARNKIRKKDKK